MSPVASGERTSLAAYSLRVKNKSTDTMLALGNCLNGSDILPFLKNFLEQSSDENHVNDAESQLCVTAKTIDQQGRTLVGIIESGKYGASTSIRNVKTGKHVYQQTPDQAAMYPFYFLFDLPPDLDRGIFILQKRGARGIRTVLSRALRSRVEALYPNSLIAIKPLLSADVVNQYLEGGEITKLRFVRFELSGDIRNHYSSGAKQIKGSMQLVASVSRNAEGLPIVGTIREYLEGKKPLQGLFELEESKFAYDTIKLEVKIGKRRKTVDLGKLIIPHAPFDISDLVGYENGHPKFEDVNKAARELLEDLRTEVYTGIHGQG